MRARSILRRKIIGTQTVILPAVTGNSKAPTQHPGAEPVKGTVRWGRVRTIPIVNKGLRRSLPGVATRLNRLPPAPERFDRLPRARE